jgi:hypothetical protein
VLAAAAARAQSLTVHWRHSEVDFAYFNETEKIPVQVLVPIFLFDG